MNRRSLFSAVVGASMCVVPTLALAEVSPDATTPAPTQTTTQPAPSTVVSVPENIQKYMEVFLVNLKVGYFDEAYKNTTAYFKKNMSLSQFKKMASVTHLGDYTSKKWTGDETKTPGLDLITGEFTGADGTVRTVTFALIKKDSSYTIDAITEAFTPELLFKLFPKDTAQTTLIKSDLALIRKTVKNRSYIRLYNAMAKSVRATVKFKDFKKSLTDFRKENHDITASKDGAFVLDDGYPMINSNGTVSVKGHYLNDSNNVQFNLTYEYMWEWKLAGLNINPTKVEEKK
ncbi:MAG: hypothetical protein NTX63_00215 [Candidatus Peregrinibacteria bacterium]|nr:hypothetical protein [Candidatus Peregrinibacteria bacterium]